MKGTGFSIGNPLAQYTTNESYQVGKDDFIEQSSQPNKL